MRSASCAEGCARVIAPYRPLLTPCMLTCHSHSSVAPLQRLPLHEGQRQRARLSLVQKAIRFNAKRLPLSNALAACRPTSAKCACKARDLRHAPLRVQPLIMLAKEQADLLASDPCGGSKVPTHAEYTPARCLKEFLATGLGR